MSKISVKILGSAIRKIRGMDLSEKESVIDNIYQEQPNLLASVLVLRKMGVTLEKMDVILNVLITLHVAFKESGFLIRKISELDQERQLKIFTSIIRFSEDMDAEHITVSINQYIASHKENIMLSYVIKELERAKMFEMNNENEKNAVLSAINLVNCLSNA